MRRTVVICVVVFFANGLLFGQDLNKLQARAQKLLDLRSTVTIDKPAAAPFIEAEKRQDFLESTPLPMQNARVTGFEFTADPKLVYVIFKANIVLPEIGPVPRTGRERWVWDKKDWFLRLEDIGNIFLTRNDPAPSTARPVPLEFASTRIDLGKHVQGEILMGTVEFKSDKDEIKIFRPAELPGLSFGAPLWKNKQEGEIKFELDTGLISKDIDYFAEFEVDGFEEQRTRAKVELVAQIEPRLRITQNPPLIDPAKPATVEFQFENLSGAPFGLKALFLTNDAYRLQSDPPTILRPGEPATITYSYRAQTENLGAQLNFELSEPVLGNRTLTLPLNIKMPAPVTPGYTREQLEEIIRKARQ